MIQALVFDFDGLILDTEGPDFQSWQEVFVAHGCELTIDAWAHCIGAPAGVFNPASHLEEILGQPVDRARLKQSHRQRFYELLEQQALLPGVESYLRDAAALGLRVGVASSATRDWVVTHLSRFGLLEFFGPIRCREDVVHGKPQPDLYLAAAEALGVRPGEAVAFEDSPNGVRAAKAAGLYCVGVPNAVTRLLAMDEADLVLDSLAELPLAALLERLDGTPR